MADPYEYIGLPTNQLIGKVLQLQQRTIDQMGTLAQDVAAVKTVADAILAIQVPMSANVSAVLALLQANNVPAAQAVLEQVAGELGSVAAGMGTSEAALQAQLTPVVGSISPNAGPIAGGTVITLIGAGYTSATAVNFTPVGGGTATPGTTLSIQDDNHLSITSPALAAGSYDIQVVNTNGTSTIVAADQFTTS